VVFRQPSEKYELVKVSWDDEIPNRWKVIIQPCSIIDYYIPLYPIKKPCSKPPSSTRWKTHHGENPEPTHPGPIAIEAAFSMRETIA
jgi:hypothetical protein